MKYKNAKKILPEELLKELQQYVQGEIIYVPGCDSMRAGWGEANGTKEKYMTRNKEIIKLHREGLSLVEIAESYYLSEYSIRKIISSSKNKVIHMENVIGQCVR